jgi:hypothetical protein
MDAVTRRRWITSVAIFFVGLAMGGGVVEGYHVAHDKTTAEVFSRRLRCDEVASQYEKRKSNDTDTVHLEMVGYSAASNSCVGYFTGWSQIVPTDTSREWRVVDVLSGEVFYEDNCRLEQSHGLERDWCGNGRDMKLGRRGEAAFRQAINGQEIDVEKIK